MSEQEWFNKDFYQVLGVPKDADDAAIKKAYRKLARTWHPDQNPGDEKAEARFKEIGEAYSVLSNTEQRRKYDAIRSMAGGGARFSAGGAGGPDLSDLFGGAFGGGGTRVNFGGGGADLNDILSGIFGGGQGGFAPGAFGSAQGGGFAGSPFSGRQTPRARKGEDRRASTSITFREALAGTEVVMTIDGSKQKVRLPKGVKDGQKIRLRGKGRPGVNGGAAGDLVVTIRVEAHPVFARERDDLRIVLPVSLSEAVLGAKVEVPLLDGSTVTVKVPAGTQSGALLRVRGRGVETGTTKGDLLIEVRVLVPEGLDEAQKAAFEAFAATLRDSNPRAGLYAKAKE